MLFDTCVKGLQKCEIDVKERVELFFFSVPLSFDGFD